MEVRKRDTAGWHNPCIPVAVRRVFARALGWERPKKAEAMFLESITNRGAAPALEKTLMFGEARLAMIAENVANVHTPGYRTKQLDVAGFQRALREALSAKGSDSYKRLEVNVGDEVETDSAGRLTVRPSLAPVEHSLLHDGTNQSMERQMAMLAETGMTHDLATMLLRGSYNGLRKAIRGTL